MSSISKCYKYGDVDERGYVYTGQTNRNKNPHWISPTAYWRSRVASVVSAARNRARKKGLPFNIDTSYVVSIFPKDNKCPVLGIPLEFKFSEDRKSGGSPNSPSLDRINPSLGYVKGNVIWVSMFANCIKQNATPAEIIAVGEFYKNLQQ